MIDKHFLGIFTHIDDVYKIYPYGGSCGDYILLLGDRVEWNDEQKRWGDNVSFNPVSGIDTQIVDGNLTITHNAKIGGDLVARIGRFGTLIAEKIELIGEPFALHSHTHTLTEISDLYKYVGDLSSRNDINMLAVWKELAESDSSKQIDISHISRAVNSILEVVDRKVETSEKGIEIRAKQNFLRKNEDDVSEGHITFNRGIRSCGEAQFDDGANFKKGNKNYGVSSDSIGLLGSIASAKDVDGNIIEDFLSGFFGHGWKLEKINGKYKLEIDDILVRGKMSIAELVAEKIRAIKGALNISQGSEAIESIQELNTQYILTIASDTNSIMEDDFILCQHFDNEQRMYHVRVLGVNGRRICVEKNEFIGYSLPHVGDDIIQFGNKTRKDRQSCIYIHADGDPSIDVMFGVDSKDWSNKTKIRLGGEIPNSGGAKGLYVVDGMFISQSENGDILYKLAPDGSANIGRGAILYDPKTDKLTLGGNVKLTWSNLDDESKTNLKGEKGEGNIFVQIVSSQGTTFTDGIHSTLKAIVFDGSTNITHTLPMNSFSWIRTSDNQDGDIVWNELHQYIGSSITIGDDDVYRKATFECEVQIND